MPYYHEKLVSNWGFDQIFEAAKPPPAVDSDVLKHLQPDPAVSGRVQWLRSPRKMPRNQIDPSRSYETNGSPATVPRPISQRTGNDERRINATANAFAQIAVSSGTDSVPQMYQCIPIDYSKWGVVGFDFE